MLDWKHRGKVVNVFLCVADRLGVKTCAFHLGDYRRAFLRPGQDVPDDYFFVNGMYRTLEMW